MIRRFRLDPTWITESGEYRVSSWAAGSQYAPAVAVNGSSLLMAAWASAGQDGSGDGIYAVRALVPGYVLFSDGFETGTTAAWTTTVP